MHLGWTTPSLIKSPTLDMVHTRDRGRAYPIVVLRFVLSSRQVAKNKQTNKHTKNKTGKAWDTCHMNDIK